MSRLTRIFGVKRSGNAAESGSEADEGLASDNAELFDDSSRDVSDDFELAYNSDSELQYLEALNEHEANTDNSKASDRLQKMGHSSMTDFKAAPGEKDDNKKHKKNKKRNKSEPIASLDGSLTSDGFTVSSAADSSITADQKIQSLRDIKKNKKRDKKIDDSAKSSRREKRGKEKKRKSKPDGSEGSHHSSKSSLKGDDTGASQRRHRSRSRTRGGSRPARAQSADPATSRPRRDSSKHRRRASSKRREGSKRDKEKDMDKKTRGTRSSKRKSSSAAGGTNLETDGALGSGSMPPTIDSATPGTNDQQRKEILRLHQMLSDALQKVATQSAEQIRDKDMLMKVSGELTKLRTDFEFADRERIELKVQLEDRDTNIEKSVGQIESLTRSLEQQRTDQAMVEKDLAQSEADVDKLLIKIEDLERALDDSGNVTDETLRSELKEAKMAMVDKNREVDTHKHKIDDLEKEIEELKKRIEELEKDLEDTATVNKLQVTELEEEVTALQGKLKGERLETSSKITSQEDKIAELEQELAHFKGNSEFEEIAVVREELEDAQDELEIASNELEASKSMLIKVKAEKEDLLERNNKLNADVKVLEKSVNELTAKNEDLEQRVLKWTEQTYEWKSKAEATEKKLGALADGVSDNNYSDAGSIGEDAAPQGLFLQAVMDKKENSKKNNRWNLFSRNGGQGGDEDQTAEDIRIRGLEEQNQGLQEKTAELQSELVKVQSAHKEEIYNKQKLISHLEEENEALKVKTKTLEQLCGADLKSTEQPDDGEVDSDGES